MEVVRRGLVQRKLRKAELCALALLAAVFVRYAGAKQGDRGGVPRGAPQAAFTPAEVAAGHVLWRVATNETWDFSAPAGAAVAEAWRRRGAAEDWISASVRWEAADAGWAGTNGEVRLRIHSGGWAEFRDGPTVRPLQAALGIVPEAVRV